MAASASLQLSLELGIRNNHGRSGRFRDSKTSGQFCFSRNNSLTISLKRYTWSSIILKRIHRRDCTLTCRNQQFRCHCFLKPSAANCVKNASLTIARSFGHFQGSPLVIKLASSIGIVIFAIWGLGPLMQLSRNILLQKSDSRWKKSSTYQVTTSYIQPLLLWAGAVLICRTLDPMILPTEAGQIVKQRLLNFVRSLSTVMAFAYCLSSVIQQAQNFFVEGDPNDTRNMGFQFAGKAVYTAVWVVAFSLFMELLGFSTQRWLTAGGLGTVLLTLAGREIFTNFLSSVMIHATRPFVLNEWIQTKIEGYEVSGTVEHVGWWSPTIIRAEDREAVYIPNHKFTVSVVRNLSQKTHWRIKTHLAISHLDVKKINSIVADMRKVLAKNPQVEQQKLHRRVFLDNIDPENQALMILISCFVKTSHLEEYLCVKEAILLDLLRVVRHHHARLATPIRTMQKPFTEVELGNVPFSDTIYDKGTATNRPVLLMEPSKINRDDKAKSQDRSPRAAGEEDRKPSMKATRDRVHAKGEVTDEKADSEFVQIPRIEIKDDPSIAAKSSSNPKLNNSTKPPSKVADTSKCVEGASSDAVNSSGPVPKTSNSKNSQEADQEITPVSSPDLGGKMPSKQDGRQPVTESPTTKSSLDENLVLGVALEGSKRMLPIEDDTAALSNAELAALSGGNGSGAAEKGKIDGKRSKSTGSLGNDQPLDHRQE